MLSNITKVTHTLHTFGSPLDWQSRLISCVMGTLPTMICVLSLPGCTRVKLRLRIALLLVMLSVSLWSIKQVRHRLYFICWPFSLFCRNVVPNVKYTKESAWFWSTWFWSTFRYMYIRTQPELSFCSWIMLIGSNKVALNGDGFFGNVNNPMAGSRWLETANSGQNTLKIFF